MLGFPRVQKHPLLRGGIKGGGRLMRVFSPGLPLGEAGSRHEVDGRLKRVFPRKQKRHSPPLRGPSLKGGLYSIKIRRSGEPWQLRCQGRRAPFRPWFSDPVRTRYGDRTVRSLSWYPKGRLCTQETMKEQEMSTIPPCYVKIPA